MSPTALFKTLYWFLLYCTDTDRVTDLPYGSFTLHGTETGIRIENGTGIIENNGSGLYHRVRTV